MLYRIVGLDPGGTTGLTAFTVSYGTIINIESYELDLVGVGHYLRTVHLISNINIILAYEVANKFQASGHMSSEVIGLARYFAAMAGIEFVPVNQSAWKRLITRDVLKRAGLSVKGTHAKDAAGVGLFHVVSSLKICQHVLRLEGSND